jgi:hypothetical protein
MCKNMGFLSAKFSLPMSDFHHSLAGLHFGRSDASAPLHGADSVQFQLPQVALHVCLRHCFSIYPFFTFQISSCVFQWFDMSFHLGLCLLISLSHSCSVVPSPSFPSPLSVLHHQILPAPSRVAHHTADRADAAAGRARSPLRRGTRHLANAQVSVWKTTKGQKRLSVIFYHSVTTMISNYFSTANIAIILWSSISHIMDCL